MLTGIFILLTAVLVLLLVLLFVLLQWSYPGKPKPFVDASGNPLPGSISEKIFVKINDVDQGMFIQTRHRENPVLLFLHGGPGMPEYFLTKRYPTGLQESLVVVWWDQRGAGLSYCPGMARESLTYEQLIADTLAVTDYLRQRFGQEKIYLMAHSGGSFIGIQAAARAPELYHAYIGIAQMSYQLESERRAYAYALEQYKKLGDANMVRRLEAAPPTMTVPLPAAYDALRDQYMHGIGVGTTRDMQSVVTGIFLPSWQFREYTLSEKLDLWRGKLLSMRALRDTAFATDLTRLVTGLDIPTYFFSGRYDYTVNFGLSKEYFEKLQAPVKGFYTFEHSAHSPFLEEPEKVRKILLEDVLAGRSSLADR